MDCGRHVRQNRPIYAMSDVVNCECSGKSKYTLDNLKGGYKVGSAPVRLKHYDQISSQQRRREYHSIIVYSTDTKLRITSSGLTSGELIKPSMTASTVLITGATSHLGFRVLVLALEAGYNARVAVCNQSGADKVLAASSIKRLNTGVQHRLRRRPRHPRRWRLQRSCQRRRIHHPLRLAHHNRRDRLLQGKADRPCREGNDIHPPRSVHFT